MSTLLLSWVTQPCGGNNTRHPSPPRRQYQKRCVVRAAEPQAHRLLCTPSAGLRIDVQRDNTSFRNFAGKASQQTAWWSNEEKGPDHVPSCSCKGSTVRPGAEVQFNVCILSPCRYLLLFLPAHLKVFLCIITDAMVRFCSQQMGSQQDDEKAASEPLWVLVYMNMRLNFACWSQ